jgi:hypothetical protein
MGPVTNYLVTMLKKQLQEQKLVLWFDPERHYQALIEQLPELLGQPDLPIIVYQGSYFSLRHEVEPYINESEPQQLLVYVDKSAADTRNALIELQMLAAEMAPGRNSPYANTRLAVIARNSLKPFMSEDDIQRLEKDIQAGKLSLSELDTLADKSNGARQGVLSLIFGTGNPLEIVLIFLTKEHYDEDITRKDATSDLKALFAEHLSIATQTNESLKDLRSRLALYILVTDLLQGIQDYGAVSDRLTSVQVATSAPARANCAEIALRWRMRRDLQESYAEQAQSVERALKIATLQFTLAQLVHAETFLALEKQLQAICIDALLQKVTLESVNLAASHQKSYWSQQSPEIQTIWASIVTTGQVLLEAERIEQALKSSPTAIEIFQAYTSEEQPWCLLDTHHRHMELRYHNFSPFTPDDHLEQLLSLARQQYMRVGSLLAERFLLGYQANRYNLPGTTRQVETYEKYVRPHLQHGKVAYVLVDAMRYEMADELARSLSPETNLKLSAVTGTAPTITVIGMAALLPDAHVNPRLVTQGKDKIALELNGTILKDRRSRIDYLKQHAGVSVFVAKLDELLPKPARKIDEGIKQAQLILITSQEIDQLGEEGNVALARRTMDDALRQLQQAFRILGQRGVETIICTADHGYLFADELSEDMKINAPGGKEVDLHRRVWLGLGGNADAAYLRAPIAELGLASELDIAVPWTFAGFKVRGGAGAYFHGGMSPQEYFIPVMILQANPQVSDTTSHLVWQLTPGSQKISTRLFSVQISGKVTGLFPLHPPKVRLELRIGKETISTPMAATYGFTEITEDIQLAATHDPQQIDPDTVTLAILKESAKASVSLHLLDATTGLELHKIDSIEMVISI